MACKADKQHFPLVFVDVGIRSESVVCLAHEHAARMQAARYDRCKIRKKDVHGGDFIKYEIVDFGFAG